MQPPSLGVFGNGHDVQSASSNVGGREFDDNASNPGRRMASRQVGETRRGCFEASDTGGAMLLRRFSACARLSSATIACPISIVAVRKVTRPVLWVDGVMTNAQRLGGGQTRQCRPQAIFEVMMKRAMLVRQAKDCS